MSKTVLLLQGGLSAEREVSFASGKPVQEALTSSGYRVVTFDPGWDVGTTLPAALSGVAPMCSGVAPMLALRRRRSLLSCSNRFRPLSRSCARATGSRARALEGRRALSGV